MEIGQGSKLQSFEPIKQTLRQETSLLMISFGSSSITSSSVSNQSLDISIKIARPDMNTSFNTR